MLGVIGGSGLYAMDVLGDAHEQHVATPFGEPSDAFVVGRLHGTDVAFLPRHGAGHRILPTELNFRANIHALKQLGVTEVVSVSAVGSLREEIVPGHLVVPDQFIDRTRGRVSTFFGDGCVAHVGFADPFCAGLSALVASSAREAGGTVHEGGTYICMEGPAFSTRAESNLYRSWGGNIIGMTNLQEAKLAREAELCFSTLALATDYDCWREEEEGVQTADILAVLAANAALARETVSVVARDTGAHSRTCGCRTALDFAVITDPARIPESTRAKLALLLARSTGVAAPVAN
ncbi:MAG: 5'-methylthioadenosine phosphorylase [Hyphomicrobiaceae bacterium]|jgi:5'-methylthioadenosine phosphorylase